MPLPFAHPAELEVFLAAEGFALTTDVSVGKVFGRFCAGLWDWR